MDTENRTGIIKKWLFLLAGLGFLVLIDQLTKIWAIHTLKDQEPITLIDGVFQLLYLENRGAAFGVMQNRQLFFIIMTSMLFLFILWMYFQIPKGRKYMPMQFIAIMLLSGALGNLIDRIRLDYVVDFFYFQLIDFPIFNVADCYVVISIALLLILSMFYYKEQDFSFISFRKDKKEHS